MTVPIALDLPLQSTDPQRRSAVDYAPRTRAGPRLPSIFAIVGSAM
jgi:hypothetical protein